jgi:lipopolysaccharide transport system permease protein
VTVTNIVEAAETPVSVPPPLARRRILSDLREIVQELRQTKEIIYQLTLRDIRIRYKQALFGFAWALLLPMAIVIAGLAMRVAFAFVAGKQIAVHQVAGMALKAVPWGFFVGCLNTTVPSLVANKALVTKVYFPREALPLGAMLAQTFDSTIALMLVAIVLPFLHVTASIQLLWVPLLLGTLWLIALGLGLFLSCANLFFRDVKYLVQVFVTFGIFVTPVLLDAAAFGPKGSPLMLWNPVGALLEGLRLSVIEHHNLLTTLYAPQGFVIWQPAYLLHAMAWAVFGLAASALFFHRSERRFAELV